MQDSKYETIPQILRRVAFARADRLTRQRLEMLEAIALASAEVAKHPALELIPGGKELKEQLDKFAG